MSSRVLNEKMAAFIIPLILILFGACSTAVEFNKEGEVLRYNFDEEKLLKYEMINSMNQEMDMMGQKIKTTSKLVLDYSLETKASDETGTTLQVTIDKMEMASESPRGKIDADTEPVIGKSFEMQVSDIGEEIDFEGVEELRFSLMEGAERGVKSNFEMLFPNLPNSPVKIGDTYPTIDTLNIEEGGMTMQMIFKSENKIVGIEEVDGYKCLKIEGKTDGSMSGSGSQGGMDFTMEASFPGTDITYFAYKEGLIIKSESISKGKGNIIGTNMTIPLTMETLIKIDLQK
ncbi:MAG: hypothetical protein K9N07_09395 [Candidatus Cloacimonetes bacterium]|nr:hypothetical protein [Candidatus Cloacimonadota bacterium]